MMNKIKNFFKAIIKDPLRIGTFILIIICLSGLRTCIENIGYNKELTIERDSLLLHTQKLDSVINKRNQEVYIQTSLITSDQKTIKSLSDEVFALKNTRKSDKVLAHVKEGTSTLIKEKLVPFKDTTGFKEFADSIKQECKDVLAYYDSNAIFVPRLLEDSTKNYSFSAWISKQGLKINEISIPDTLNLRFVEHKGGLFKKDTKGKRHFILRKNTEIQILHSNPLVKTTELQSFIYKPKAKSRWLEKVILVAGSSYLTYKLLK